MKSTICICMTLLPSRPCPTDLARALRGVRVAEAALVALEVGEVPGAGGGAAAGQARAHGAAYIPGHSVRLSSVRGL